MLGTIPISSIPVNVDRGWDGLLEGTALAGIPLQNVTLAEVLALNLPGVNQLQLQQLDLSSTPLGRIPIGAIVLGDVPLSQLHCRPAPRGAASSSRTFPAIPRASSAAPAGRSTPPARARR